MVDATARSPAAAPGLLMCSVSETGTMHASPQCIQQLTAGLATLCVQGALCRHMRTCFVACCVSRHQRCCPEARTKSTTPERNARKARGLLQRTAHRTPQLATGAQRWSVPSILLAGARSEDLLAHLEASRDSETGVAPPTIVYTLAQRDVDSICLYMWKSGFKVGDVKPDTHEHVCSDPPRPAGALTALCRTTSVHTPWSASHFSLSENWSSLDRGVFRCFVVDTATTC